MRQAELTDKDLLDIEIALSSLQHRVSRLDDIIEEANETAGKYLDEEDLENEEKMIDFAHELDYDMDSLLAICDDFKERLNEMREKYIAKTLNYR